MKNVKQDQAYSLLKEMCAIHAPSGNEVAMKEFVLNYIEKNKKNWKHKPKIYAGDDFQDNIVLIFGKPRTGSFCAHRQHRIYGALWKTIGKNRRPVLKQGFKLIGKTLKGLARCRIELNFK